MSSFPGLSAKRYLPSLRSAFCSGFLFSEGLVAIYFLQRLPPQTGSSFDCPYHRNDWLWEIVAGLRLSFFTLLC